MFEGVELLLFGTEVHPEVETHVGGQPAEFIEYSDTVDLCYGSIKIRIG